MLEVWRRSMASRLPAIILGLVVFLTTAPFAGLCRGRAALCLARSLGEQRHAGLPHRPAAGLRAACRRACSFAAWLRGLPLKPAGAPVLLHTGAPKPRQDVHVAVIDIDVGARDLQQCADAVMRLRAEWQFASGRPGDIAFNDTGAGKPIAFARWAAGERPHMSGRSLSWSRGAAPDASYASFRRYMDVVFIWAGTYSLERELTPKPVAELAAGDLFIKGGFPGHAVLVADAVENRATGERRFLLVQSFMPAQEMHVLKIPPMPTARPGIPWPSATGSSRRSGCSRARACAPGGDNDPQDNA